MTTLFEPAAGTVRHKQTAAVAALSEMLTYDLPPLAWDIAPYATGVHLTAQALVATDEEGREVLAEWAEFLGAEVQETAHKDYTALLIDTVRLEDGVHIRIFKHVNVSYDYVKVPKAATEELAGGEA